jgi:hypothetical protein
LSTILPDQAQAPRRSQIPADNPFLEAVFAAICDKLYVLPGETFVDQARRWTGALAFAAALKPRSPQEWLQAADVTITQYSAIQCMVMRKRNDISAKQRTKLERDFIAHAKALQNARRRYDLLRDSGN